MSTLGARSVTPAPPARAPGPPRTALAVVGGVLAANAVLLAPRLFFSSDPYSEIAGTDLHLVHYLVWTACLVALSQALPGDTTNHRG